MSSLKGKITQVIGPVVDISFEGASERGADYDANW